MNDSKNKKMIKQKTLEKISGRNLERYIQVENLNRLPENETFQIKLKEKSVHSIQLNLLEPPRFIENILRSRHYTEAPDFVSRICGYCSASYQIGSTIAIEDALHLQVNTSINQFRKIFLYTEWIKNHALHLYMLHIPYFYAQNLEIKASFSDKCSELAMQGYKLREISEQILKIIGGRAIHPINIKVGGFYKFPNKKDWQKITLLLEEALKIAEQSFHITEALEIPNYTHEHPHLCSVNSNAKEYLSLNNKIQIQNQNFSNHEYMNLWKDISIDSKEKIFHTGPLARIHYHYDRMPDKIKKLADEINMKERTKNPFMSLLAIHLEINLAIEESLKLIQKIDLSLPSNIEVEKIKAGYGFSSIESSRGTLFQYFEVGTDGLIYNAKIISPTIINQNLIKSNIKNYINKNIHLNNEDMIQSAKHLIIAQEPCISCSKQLLNINIEK